mgnify:CR=1 FL=1
MPSCVVIDDSGRVRDIAIALLSEVGIEGWGAADVATGLELLAQMKPDAILLDWDLPEHGALDVLTGTVEVALPRPVTVLMATENDPKQFALARAAGASGVLIKPFDRHDFRAALTRAGVLAVDSAQAGMAG